MWQADPRRLTARLAHQLDVRDVDEQLRVDDAALLELLAGGRTLSGCARVLLRARGSVDEDSSFGGDHADHASGVTAVLAGHHSHVVVLVDVDTRHG